MKLLYGAGSHGGANIQLKRFLEHTTHDVRYAAYLEHSDGLSINWLLDALKSNKPFIQRDVNNLFEHTGVPRIDITSAEFMLGDVADWKPDLVITDAEPIVAHIALSLEIPLWSCSPLHLIDGIKWKVGQLGHYSKLLKKTKKFLSRLPEPDKKFVYSPFCDVFDGPQLLNGYEWVRPYYSLPSLFPGVDDFQYLKNKIALIPDGNIVSGITSFISDTLYNGSKFCISINPDDPETIINAAICTLYNLALDVGTSEIDYEYANDMIDKYLSFEFKSQIEFQPIDELHERIDNEFCF